MIEFKMSHLTCVLLAEMQLTGLTTSEEDISASAIAAKCRAVSDKREFNAKCCVNYAFKTNGCITKKTGSDNHTSHDGNYL